MRQVLGVMLIATTAALTSPAVAQESPPAAQQAPPKLERFVSIERQRALGMDQLTAEQRAEMARLLLEVYQLGVQSGQERAAGPGQPKAEAAAPTGFESKVEGEFSGWAGETMVKLLNGEVWRQVENYYHYYYAYMPRVLVYRTADGYKMKVDGVDKAVGVERVR